MTRKSTTAAGGDPAGGGDGGHPLAALMTAADLKSPGPAHG